MKEVKLPVPIIVNDKQFQEVEIKSLEAGVITDTHKAAQDGNSYDGLKVFCAGCVTKIKDIVEPVQIRSIISKIPYQSALYLSVQILLEDGEDDAVQGIYECPLCGKKIKCIKNDKIDTADYLSDLKVEYADKNKPVIYELKKKFEFDVPDQGSMVIDKFEFQQATLKHCSNTFQKYGSDDVGKLQYGIWTEALLKINGTEFDNKWKSRWCQSIFRKVSKKDMTGINNEIHKYGYQTKVKKVCKCGNEFKVNLNTLSFFVSALQED